MITDHCGIFIPNANAVKSENNPEPKEELNLAFLINFNDHLQISANTKEFNLHKLYNNIENLALELENELNFDKNQEVGYLTSCPSFAGAGVKVSAIISIPLAINNGNTAIYLNRWSLRVKKLNNNLSEVQSKLKLKVAKEAFVNSFVIKILSLINFQENLQANDYTIKKCTSLQGSIKSTYDYFFDTYKILSSFNQKQCFLFNDQFISNFKGNNIVISPLTEELRDRIKFSYEINTNSSEELLLTDYSSVHVYKDFINDYITGETGLNMVKYIEDITTNKQSLNDLYKKKLEIKIEEKQDITSNFIFSRNFEELNFFNSEDSKYNSNLVLSQDKEILILEELKKSYIVELVESNIYLVKERENSNNFAKIILATEKSVKETNGDHLTVQSHSYQLAENIVHKIESKIPYHFDIIFGYLARNVLFSGSGLKHQLIFLKEKYSDIEKIKTIIEKHDYKIKQITDTSIIVENMFSLNSNVNQVVEKGSKILSEI